MIRHILTVFIFCFCLPVNGQNLTYSVFLREEKVGELLVKRTIGKDFMEYKADSRIAVDKIINMVIDYHMSARFEEGIMVRSAIRQQSNNRVNVNTTTTRTGNIYYVVDRTGSKNKVNDVIDYNLCMLYFQEPIGKTRVWSDSYGEFIRIRSVGAHKYELLLPDGKRNFYSYTYGICTLVETEQLFSKIVFRLTPAK